MTAPVYALDRPEEVGAAANLVSSRFAPSMCKDVLRAAARAGFSAQAYYDANPDLGSAFGSASRAALHFLAVSRSERRSFPIDLDFEGLHELSVLPVADRTLLSGLISSLVMAWLYRAGEPFELMIERVSPCLPELRRLGAQPYFLIGDSHSLLYRRSTASNRHWLLPLHCDCSGGSAFGLGNPLSRSGYRQRIHAVMKRLGEITTAASVPVLFQFGQVDLEFVQPFRRVAAGSTVFEPAVFDEFAQSSVDAYVGFLAEIVPRHRRHRVDVLAIFPPALADEVLGEGYVNGHIARLEAGTDPDVLKSELMAVMKSVIGEPMLLHLALTGFLSTRRAWHQDDYLNPPNVANWYAAVWMALGDITAECGPFEYVPGSHRWGLMRLEKVKAYLTAEELARREPKSGNNEWPKYAERFVTPAVERQIARSGVQPRTFLGKKGDVLIWHGRLMHQGSLPSDPRAERRSLITHYSGVNHRPDMPARVADPSGGQYAVFDHPFR